MIEIRRDAGPVATVRTKQTVEFGKAVELWALSFDDGYHTCWYSSLDRAMRAGARHLRDIGVI